MPDVRIVDLQDAIILEIRLEMTRQRLNQSELAGRLGDDWNDQRLSIRMHPDPARRVDFRVTELYEIARVLDVDVRQLMPPVLTSSDRVVA